MSGLRGFVAGLAGLSLLEVVVSNQAAAGRVSGAFGLVSRVLSRWLDPQVPLIPAVVTPEQVAAARAKEASGSSSTGGAVYTQPAPGTKPRQTPTGPQPAIVTV